MSSINDSPKSINRYTTAASGIKYFVKGKRPKNQKTSHRDFYQGAEYSVDIELEEKPEISGKYKNQNKFKPSTKQTVDQNEYKKLKKKYDFEEIEEKSEEEPQKDTKEKNSSISSIRKSQERSETPPSRVTKNIYTEQYRTNKKIILDDDEEEEIANYNKKNDKKEEEQDLDMDNHLDNSNQSDKEKEKGKEKEEKINKKKKDKKNQEINKREKKEEKNDNESDKGQDDDINNSNKNDVNNNKSEGEYIDNNKNIKKKKNKKTKNKKWNEEEYRKILAESKEYIPFKDYDINQFILTLSQMNNIKNNPDLYKKYNNFLSMKKKQDKIGLETLTKNVLQIFKNITKIKNIQTNFTVNSLFKNINYEDYEYKSSEKTAYFDLFLCFISMYISADDSLIKLTSMFDTNKLVIPFHALAFIFSSQLLFCDIAKLMQSYYDKFLSYKIIPIYKRENEDYLHKINTRHIIWKQFETPFLYFKNKKQLYLRNGDGESNLDEKKMEEFGNKIENNINQAYNCFVEKIVEKHGNINAFNLADKRINLTDKINSVPSSLYNQINGDIKFKLKMDLYKYKMKQLKMRKLCKLNDAMIKKRKFNNNVKNHIFRQSAHYMNSCDIVQDFLDNYN